MSALLCIPNKSQSHDEHKESREQWGVSSEQQRGVSSEQWQEQEQELEAGGADKEQWY
jgi:hypothetical protein